MVIMHVGFRVQCGEVWVPPEAFLCAVFLQVHIMSLKELYKRKPRTNG